MALWTFWSGEALRTLASLDGFSVDSTSNVEDLVALTELAQDEVETRLANGHRCYVARLAGTPVAYGWAASDGASIGELTIDFSMREQDCYLWDFQTLPSWRGRGLYPRLLQSIVEDLQRDRVRFWIINAPENVASAKGIERAGFRLVGDLAFADDGRAALVAADPATAVVGASLLGVDVIDTPGDGVSPCWSCVMDALRQGATASCWPTGSLATSACTCGASRTGN